MHPKLISRFPSLPTLALAGLIGVLQPAGLHAAAPAFPTSFGAGWSTFGRAIWKPTADSIIIQNGTAISKESFGDCEFTFRAKMPKDAAQVQLWGAIRVKDRDNRYVFGLRGGAEPELSLARYAPDNEAKFLGWAPLDFTPELDKWYTFRVAVSGKRFQVFLNDEKLPRINVEDTDALWTQGAVGLGGGWLPAEFASPKVTPLTGQKLSAFNAIGQQTWAPPAVDKSALRAKQRAAYAPVKIDALPAVRGEFSLDGNWLFMPDQDLAKGAAPIETNTPDQDWHIIPVPSFWTSSLGWLHGEGNMPGLKGIAASRGPSDMLVAEDDARVNAQTFDWDKTKGGWYRQYLDLPANLAGREFELVFDAIAKISDIYVNGQKVTSNVGMFRQIRCDVTKYLKPGRNVIAVHDIGIPDRKVKDATKVMAVAVTVEVNNEMLSSLPHGMTDFKSGGIWQPVRLVVTNPVRLGELFIQPALDGATAEVEVQNRSAQARTVALAWKITGAKDQSTLFAAPQPIALNIPANGAATAKLATPKLQPQLWSPTTPNLYNLDLTVSEGGKVVDQQSTRFGFRTFAVKDGKLLLNGHPYWLRGGDHFPVTLRPNDEALAKKFITLAKEGNVAITRSHAIPFTEPWFEAADELGMGVSYEGTWPWLMLEGPPPDPALLKVWKDEFASLIRRYRNHPSVLFWTVNNEMKFPMIEKLGPDVLKQKWAILSDMIKTMREIDPTRPIVSDSSYTRKEGDKKSKEIRESNKFDDGDIDDLHTYNGWYNPSPFHLFDGQFTKNSTPGRPFISQEFSTGYPRNDDWPSRSYQFPRYVPQALVGNYAYEQNDPAIFMSRQAFMTKEVAEVIRRTNREDANGVLHFAYLTWFTDVWKADSIKPKLTYYALKTALQPVLVSAELYGRHFYAGETVSRRVALINDSLDYANLGAGTLTWEVRSGETVLATGTQPTPPVPYYTNKFLDVKIAMPAKLPTPKVSGQLAFKYEVGGKVVSTNSYGIIVATKEWAAVQPPAAGAKKPLLFDPKGLSAASTADIPVDKISNLSQLDPKRTLIVGDVAALVSSSGGVQKFKAFVDAGGRALLLQPGKDLVRLFPDDILSYRQSQGEIVTMTLPESPVFDGIEPLDTSWFEMGDRQLPYASSGTFMLNRENPAVTQLALECELHPDIKEGTYPRYAGAPIVEIRSGKGAVIASEMMFSAKDKDPIAGRLLANMLAYLK